MPAPHRSAIVFIFITVLIDSIGFGIIIPVLPELIMHLSGASLSDAARYGGWLNFVYAVAQFFCAPIIGNLGDRFGRRPVLLAALFALGIDYLVMGFAPVLVWLFAGRFIAGIAGASYSPAYAYIADISPPEKRAQNFGFIGAAFGIGFVLGPSIGGLLGTLGPRMPFLAAAALALLNATFGLFALPESLPRERRRAFQWSRANPLGALLQLRKQPVVLGLAGVAFLWLIAHQVLPSTWAFYTMFRFDWSTAAVGYSLAASGIVMAISQAGLTRVLVPKLGGERRAATVGLVSGAAVFSCYAFAPYGWVLYIGIVVWGLAALSWPSLNALMSQQVPPDAQGELQGALASLSSVAAVLGPPLMTQLFGRFSEPGAPVHFPGAPFLAAALLALASAVILLQISKSPRRVALAPELP
ncbi:MAG TPA: TCR/Tet family MFS transporter [Steroidobacteraceae bacterium]|jgi:DHA1 family tetracycline resistance protein-like MFS transporter|nr:TCR/Tet family MFS transporter [Steroidobacteraceae bacterium]